MTAPQPFHDFVRRARRCALLRVDLVALVEDRDFLADPRVGVVLAALLGDLDLLDHQHDSARRGDRRADYFARVTACPVLFLIAFIDAVTIAYASTLRFVDRSRWLVDIPLAIDAVRVSAFIYFTGGSPGRQG